MTFASATIILVERAFFHNYNINDKKKIVLTANDGRRMRARRRRLFSHLMLSSSIHALFAADFMPNFAGIHAISKGKMFMTGRTKKCPTRECPKWNKVFQALALMKWLYQFLTKFTTHAVVRSSGARSLKNQ